VSRRGRPVPGISARKDRATRRARRGEADRLRRSGVTPPASVISPEDLVQVARWHRQQQETDVDEGGVQR
jgi:hypothetical protein